MDDFAHLARRFFASLRPGRPDPADEKWLLTLLSEPQRVLYLAQPEVDRVHSIRNATFVRDHLGAAAPTDVVVASALHDVGKAAAGLGTIGRVTAALIEPIAGTNRLARWRGHGGNRARLAAQVAHAEIGATLLTDADSEPIVVAWARGHHLADPPGLDPEVTDLLRRADRA